MTAVAAILSVAIIVQQRLLIHQTQLANVADQSYLLLQGVSEQAIQDILDYATAWNDHAQNQHLLILPAQLGPKRINNVILHARIIDEQGLFNVNNLLSLQQRQGFSRLLLLLDPQQGISQNQNLLNAISSWVTPGNNMNDLYARLEPAYRKSGQPMLDVSELRLVVGVDAQLLNVLRPFIMALPLQAQQSLPLNVNQAPAQVLCTLPNVVSFDQAQAMASCRQRHQLFLTVDAFNQSCASPLGIKNLNLSGLTTHSQYFLIEATAQNADQQVFLNTLVVTQPDKNRKMVARVIWQQGS